MRKNVKRFDAEPNGMEVSNVETDAAKEHAVEENYIITFHGSANFLAREQMRMIPL